MCRGGDERREGGRKMEMRIRVREMDEVRRRGSDARGFYGSDSGEGLR